MKKKKKKFSALLFNLVAFSFSSLSYIFYFIYLYSCFHFQIVHQDLDWQRTFSNRVV